MAALSDDAVLLIRRFAAASDADGAACNDAAVSVAAMYSAGVLFKQGKKPIKATLLTGLSLGEQHLMSADFLADLKRKLIAGEIDQNQYNEQMAKRHAVKDIVYNLWKRLVDAVQVIYHDNTQPAAHRSNPALPDDRWHPGTVEATAFGKRYGKNLLPLRYDEPGHTWRQALDKNWGSWSCCSGAANSPPCAKRH